MDDDKTIDAPAAAVKASVPAKSKLEMAATDLAGLLLDYHDAATKKGGHCPFCIDPVGLPSDDASDGPANDHRASCRWLSVMRLAGVVT